MAEASPPANPLRRVLTGEESAQLRRRPPTNRFSTMVTGDDGAAPTPGVRRRSTTANLEDGATRGEGVGGVRRRGSNFSDYSLREARRSFQSSTDDLLLPKAKRERGEGGMGAGGEEGGSAWHSAPLAFALLPAVGGMLFTNGSSIITDVMLLGLAAIFLNWSVRIPWDWYHSAQAIRKNEEYDGDTMVMEESEDENALSFSTATLEEVPEEEIAGQTTTQTHTQTQTTTNKPIRRLPAHEAATNELYTHEVLALLSCFLFPVFGAYLLHTIRSQLTRPSEGLVSNYNLTIFLLASELRPMAHLVKLIQSRTLHLQRVVNSNPYDSIKGKGLGEGGDLVRRLEDLEARASIAETPANSDPTLSGKQSSVLTTEVRRTLQPDLDALNRAVRRYEKRATLQAFQTESRLHELEARLNDAISLAAAAANNGQRQRGFTGIVVEWAATTIVLPVQAFGALAALPFKAMMAVLSYGRTKVVGHPPAADRGKKTINGRYLSNGRGERVPGRPIKKIPTSNT